MSAPLTAVMEAIRDGCDNIAGLATRTGLSEDLVRAGLAHLTRLGMIEATELTAGCPGGGCGSCALACTGGRPGCTPSSPLGARQPPTLVQLRLRR